MPTDPKEAVERLEDRIRTSEEIRPNDRDNLLAFIDRLRLLRTVYGDHRREKLLRHCTILAEELNQLTEALDDREAAESIVKWINRNYPNEETNKDYRGALRAFAKRVTEGPDIPSSVDWVPSGTSRNYDPKPNPSEMLHWKDDVIPMIDETRNARDAALIAVAWDSGARSGEIQAMSVGDVSDHTHGLQITVDGKRGQRSITLFNSGSYLIRWLQDHPCSDQPNADLWCKLSSGESISYQMYRKALNQAADRAGVTKPVTLTNFRKSSASHLASQNVNQAHIENHHGWKRGSKVAARYIVIFGSDSDRELAKAYGLEVDEEETEPIGPLSCPRCQRETPRHEEFCVWCGQALEPGAVESVRQTERDVRDAVFRLARSDPELLTERERIEGLMRLVESRPDLIDDAERYLDALESTS
ncbi:site-specific integrase [Salinigranum salinum]|uniref:site-specific integrase n=1 Tax=Salinigranum salinum TaxID=1364937 RepID=UPI0012605B24|nr:site-specific integrase [Salinigranum salinum]